MQARTASSNGVVATRAGSAHCVASRAYASSIRGCNGFWLSSSSPRNAFSSPGSGRPSRIGVKVPSTRPAATNSYNDRSYHSARPRLNFAGSSRSLLRAPSTARRLAPWSVPSAAVGTPARRAGKVPGRADPCACQAAQGTAMRSGRSPRPPALPSASPSGSQRQRRASTPGVATPAQGYQWLQACRE